MNDPETVSAWIEAATKDDPITDHQADYLKAELVDWAKLRDEESGLQVRADVFG